ncbi:MAG: signal peptidase II [Planctomycetota bacterium]|nr:MAG: signal peptidase II [Planctomycetota bacterium]
MTAAADGGRARWRRFIPIPLIVALDLWSKHAAFAYLESRPDALVYDVCGHERVPVVGEWLALMRATNPGMAFTLLEDVPWLLVSGRVAAVGLIGWLLWRAHADQKLFRIALVCVLGGALGNLHDNLLLPAPPDHPFGEVRDFVDVYIKSFGSHGPFSNGHFPTFNVADSFITVGAVLMLIASFRPQRAPEPVAAP